MTEKVKLFISDGFDPRYSVVMTWRNLCKTEKKRLNFLDLLLVLSIKSEFISLKERSEAFKLIRPMCVTFQKCAIVYNQMSKICPEKEDFLELAQSKAVYFYHFLWVFKRTPNLCPKKEQRFEIIRKKALSFNYLMALWVSLEASDVKKSEALALVKTKAKSYEEQSLMNVFSERGGPDKEEIFDSMYEIKKIKEDLDQIDRTLNLIVNLYVKP